MMNTQDKWTTTVQAHDPERKAFWQSVFGTDTLPVVSVIPQWGMLPGKEGLQLVFMLDLGALTRGQCIDLMGALSGKFGLLMGQVEELFDEHGVPILASDVTVLSSDWGQIALMIDEDDDLEEDLISIEWDEA